MHESNCIEPRQCHAAAVIGSGRGDSRSVDRRKDLRRVAALGGAACGMDNSVIGPASIQSAPLGATGEPKRDSRIDREATVRASRPIDRVRRAAVGGASGETTGALRLGAGAMGRADAGPASEAALWGRGSCAPSGKVAASDGLPDEAGWLRLCPGESRRRQALPDAYKKSFGT